MYPAKTTRLCIVNEFFYPDAAGGTGTVLSDLARRLQDTHPELSIDVVTSRHLYRQEQDGLAAVEDWDGIHIHRLATPKPNGRSTAYRLYANLSFTVAALCKMLTLGKQNLVLIGTAPPMVAMAARAFQSLTRTPYIYIVYDLEPDRSVVVNVLAKGSLVARLFRRGQAHWLRSAARVVVLGRCMQERLQAVYGLPASRLAVIPIGADAEDIYPSDKRTAFRAKHGLDGFLVLYSGNFGRYHDFDTILDAAKQLQGRAETVRFVLVGNGAQKDHIRRRIAQESIDNVTMLDFVPKKDYRELLASADVSLVTLETGMEGLCVPSKFYSILASGRPTIAMVSPTSEVARVIGEAGCGVRIDQQDTPRLVETLLSLAADPALLGCMGRNARAVLQRRYSSSRVADQYWETMQSVLGTSVRPALVYAVPPSDGDGPGPTREDADLPSTGHRVPVRLASHPATLEARP